MPTDSATWARSRQTLLANGRAHMWRHDASNWANRANHLELRQDDGCEHILTREP
jgi:hypothetical protein